MTTGPRLAGMSAHLHLCDFLQPINLVFNALHLSSWQLCINLHLYLYHVGHSGIPAGPQQFLLSMYCQMQSLGIHALLISSARNNQQNRH